MTMRGVTHLATATTASTPTLTTASKQQQQHSATGMIIASSSSSSSSSSRSSIGGISASGGGGVLSSVRSRHQNLFTCRPRDGSLRRRSRHRLLDEGGRGASTATRAKKGEEDGHGRDETTAANVESCLTCLLYTSDAADDM